MGGTRLGAGAVAQGGFVLLVPFVVPGLSSGIVGGCGVVIPHGLQTTTTTGNLFLRRSQLIR